MSKHKLPRTLVKPPVGFDNPFRRTESAPETTAAEDTQTADNEMLARNESSPDEANLQETDTPDTALESMELSVNATNDAPEATPIISINKPKNPVSRGGSKKSAPSATTTEQRITLRIEDSLRRALETECYKRRIAGQKTNITEIARDILIDWAKAKPLSLSR